MVVVVVAVERAARDALAASRVRATPSFPVLLLRVHFSAAERRHSQQQRQQQQPRQQQVEANR